MASDKMISGTGALLIILGILVVLTPWVLFPVCEVQGMYMKTAAGMQMPMKCGWSARAETSIGALIILAGALLIVRGTPETRQAVGLFSIAYGILVILFPTLIIGMCAVAEHPCRQLTLPALEVLGVIVIIVGAFLLWKRSDQKTE